MSAQRGPIGIVSAVFAAIALYGGVSVVGEEITQETNTTLYSLQSQAKPGGFSKIDVLLEIRGDLKIRGDNKVEKLPMQAKGTLGYKERLLHLGDDALTGLRSLRHYEKAEVDIQVHGDRSHRALPEESRLIAVNRKLENTELYCVEEPLTRDDLDLIEIPCNSLLVEGLLPGYDLPIGSTWPHSDHLLAALLSIDAVSSNDVQSKFVSVEKNMAKIEMAGTVEGAVAGVATEMDIKARYLFDTLQGRIVWMAMIIKERRSIGHVAPGLDAVARLQMTVRPLKSAPELSDEVIARLPTVDEETRDLLVFESNEHGFAFVYPRSWYIVNEDENLVVMRMIERGDLIAQCNISPLGRKPASHATTLDTLQRDIKSSLGQNFGSFARASEGTTSSGLTIHEVVAQGTASSQPMQWRYYVVGDESGNRLTFAFTLESSLVPRLGEIDRQIVTSVQFIAPARQRAAQSAEKATRR